MHSSAAARRCMGILVLSLFSNACSPPTTQSSTPSADVDDHKSSFDGSFLRSLYSGVKDPPSPVCATTYYIDAADGDDGYDGLTESTAWRTIARVNHSAFNPGDCVLFKRGQSWNERLEIPSSGSEQQPITFGAYGSGDKPIISAMGEVPGWDNPDAWTHSSTHRWWITCDDHVHSSPKRLWLSGTEQLRAETPVGVNATHRWYYENDSSRLYVYATANPSAAYHRIEQGGISVNAIGIAGKSFVTLQNLDVRGGASESIGVYGSNNVIIEGCNVGWGSDVHGILATAKEWEPFAPYSNGGTIRWNVIDSGHRLYYATYEKVYPEDGILLKAGANYWNVYENEVRDWGHTAIGIEDGPERTASHNNVYSNLMTSPNTAYMRGFAVGSWNGGSRHNHIYYNTVRDTTVRSQLGGRNNTVRCNLFHGIRNSPYKTYGTAQAVYLGHSNSLSDRTTENNTVSNNIVYDTDEAGIAVHAYDESYTIRNNTIENNIILKAGNASRHDELREVGLWVADQKTLTSNVFRGNVIYRAGTEHVVSYRRNHLSVSLFNGENGTLDDVIRKNTQLDRGFLDPEGDEFSFHEESPFHVRKIR